MRATLLTAPLVAALVGYGSTIALVLSAAAAVGATEGQTASWVFAICLAKAAAGAWLSWRHRIPAIIAWSTPGAAMVAATSGIAMAEAVGAFLLAGALIALTGAVRPLGRAVAAIPDGVAGAMLAGVLLPFCLRLPEAAKALPGIVLPMVAVFAGVRLWNPAIAVLAALGTGAGLAFALGHAAAPALPFALPGLTLVAPSFRAEVLIGLGLPLYLVTMASQNLPGFATLRAHGYDAPVGPALMATGGASAVSALAGAHTISMAAITAAICMGPDTHPDPAQRWKAGIVYAGFWLLLGLFGPVILALIGALPAPLVTAIVGLALIGPFMGAATTAFAAPETRFPAAATLVVTASGVAVWGVGAAFWGLAAGLVLVVLARLR
ncbi:MAG: benzoate/H(+) symporter BenE family transporter [Paracoccaceae bacterium]|nr:MAG: benzoate/H(+) symporter BenE family transporter [Paracoccaceae bacterium]